MSARRNRRVAVLFGLAAVLGAAACDSTSFPESAAGTYDLLSINGQPLPFPILVEPGRRVEVASGLIILEPDGEFDQEIRYEQITPRAGSTTQFDTLRTTAGVRGEVSVEGGRIRFDPRFEGNFSGTLADGVITYDRPTQEGINFTWRFVRDGD